MIHLGVVCGLLDQLAEHLVAQLLALQAVSHDALDGLRRLLGLEVALWHGEEKCLSSHSHTHVNVFWVNTRTHAHTHTYTHTHTHTHTFICLQRSLKMLRAMLTFSGLCKWTSDVGSEVFLVYTIISSLGRGSSILSADAA